MLFIYFNFRVTQTQLSQPHIICVTWHLALGAVVVRVPRRYPWILQSPEIPTCYPYRNRNLCTYEVDKCRSTCSQLTAPTNI